MVHIHSINGDRTIAFLDDVPPHHLHLRRRRASRRKLSRSSLEVSTRLRRETSACSPLLFMSVTLSPGYAASSTTARLALFAGSLGRTFGDAHSSASMCHASRGDLRGKESLSDIGHAR